MTPSVFTFLAICIALVVFANRQLLQNWERAMDKDFKDAIKRLNIEQYEVLADKVSHPSKQKLGEVHRILRSPDDQHFLYLYTQRSPGVLQPITKERALLAIKLNG